MNEVLSWASVVATVLFGALSIYFYLRSRRVRRLAIAAGTATLQQRAYPDVRITYRDQEVDTLTRVFGFLWNSGTLEIRSSDVPQEQWPSIRVLESTRILSAAIIQRSSDHTAMEIERIDESGIQFRFAYLNPDDGVVFELLVDGDLAPSDLQISAPVIGGSAPQIGDLGGKLTRDLALSILETTGSLLSGVASAGWFVQRTTLTVSGHAAYACAFTMGTAAWALANYLDLRRLHRRLPAFAHRYLNSTMSRYRSTMKKARTH